MGQKKYEIDMCNGPLLGKILLFAIPLMLSSMLQLFFNAADVIVVGRFVGPQALAAVGSTSSLVNLLINMFIGFSVGTNVMTARYLGTNNKKGVSEIVHTSLLFAFLSGIALVFVGFFLSKPLLSLMGTPEDVLDQATLYIKVYFAGMPVIMVYNFGNAVFRAAGDTRRPLYYLAVAGVVNVALNIFFVTQLNMEVEGVALATVLSQVLSVVLLLRAMTKTDSSYKFEFRKLSIKKKQLKQIVRIGFPAGLQGSLFSISNVLIQSSINLFGSLAMAGSAAANNVENFTYVAMNAFHQTALSFVSQNLGAGKIDRIKRTTILCEVCVVVTGLVFGVGLWLVGKPFLGIFSSDAEVIRYGMIKLTYVCAVYFLCGVMDVLVGCIRGLGCSVMPMIVSLVGVCGLRIVWIFTVFQKYKTLEVLYASYSVTWTVTAICHAICFVVVYKKLKSKQKSLA